MACSPYYQQGRKWKRGLKPQLVLPPIETLVGEYVWMGGSFKEKLADRGQEYIFELKNDNGKMTLGKISGRFFQVFPRGQVSVGRIKKDAESVEYWQLEFGGTPGLHSEKIWQLYVSSHKDDNGFNFVEIREAKGSWYAYGRRHVGLDIAKGFSDTEKERIDCLPGRIHLLNEPIFWREKLTLMPGNEEFGAPYCRGRHGMGLRGLRLKTKVPPYETLVGQYVWAETGCGFALGPNLRNGITLEVPNTRADPVNINRTGHLGGRIYTGCITHAFKKVPRDGAEFWQLCVESNAGAPHNNNLKGGDRFIWQLFVSHELDDNGHPFIQLHFDPDASNATSHFIVYGYGKRQIDGREPEGFTISEKKRIGFRTDEAKGKFKPHGKTQRSGNKADLQKGSKTSAPLNVAPTVEEWEEMERTRIAEDLLGDDALESGEISFEAMAEPGEKRKGSNFRTSRDSTGDIHVDNGGGLEPGPGNTSPSREEERVKEEERKLKELESLVKLQKMELDRRSKELQMHKKEIQDPKRREMKANKSVQNQAFASSIQQPAQGVDVAAKSKRSRDDQTPGMYPLLTIAKPMTSQLTHTLFSQGPSGVETRAQRLKRLRSGEPPEKMAKCVKRET